MEFRRATLENCDQATGTVVVIDVLRAFSTAAYAFNAGAKEIILVSGVEEALRLREEIPGALVMGEVGGYKVEGFDFGNSPTEILGQTLAGCSLIHRTSAGTQGVVRSRRADEVLTSSFVCASATALYLKAGNPESVTFVVTGSGRPGTVPEEGDEDAACADYLEAWLRGSSPNPNTYLERVINSPAGMRFADPEEPELPASDLDYCLRLNAFDFAMRVTYQDGRRLLLAVDPVQAAL